MAYREVLRMEIAEVVRRWQAGSSQRNIASGTGLSRDTVRKYLAAAKEAGVDQEGPAPTEEQLSRLAAIGRAGPRQSAVPTEDKLAPWADQVYQWLTGDRLQVTRVQELLAERGCRVSYASLHRFVACRNWRGRSRSTVRMEDTAPGEVAELDFGRLGLVPDPETGRRRMVWALIVVLAYSRQSFVWPTFSQKLEDVIAGLEAAWAFFGGVPKYLVIDNFPAAVAGADALHPRLTRGFLEYSHTENLSAIRPGCPTPRTSPRWSGASSTSGNASSRAETSGICPMSGLRQQAGTGTSRTPDTRHHQASAIGCLSCRGAPSPRLLGWRVLREMTHWRAVKVHPDRHVACQCALYSVPADLCTPGQQVEIGLGSKLARIYHRGKLIETHLRQPRGDSG